MSFSESSPRQYVTAASCPVKYGKFGKSLLVKPILTVNAGLSVPGSMVAVASRLPSTQSETLCELLLL